MQDLDRITSPDRDFHASIQFVYYVQYQLHRQLLTVSKYAAEHQVVLKGDLPIGELRAAVLSRVRLPDCRPHHPICSAACASASKPSNLVPLGYTRSCCAAGVDKRSVDTWLHPTQFRMNVGTGAPPDMFATLGQNWGFPTYVWSEMEKDGYRFWRQRLTHMSQCAPLLATVFRLSLMRQASETFTQQVFIWDQNACRYFSAYRIDHILGFFRIWEIPGDCVTGGQVPRPLS